MIGSKGSARFARAIGMQVGNEKQYRALLDAMPDPVVVYDARGEAIYSNDAFEQTYGWTKEELLGHRLDFVPLEEMEPTRIAWERTLKGEKVVFETRRLTREKKLLHIQLRTAIIKDPAGRHIASIVIHRDVTASRQAKRELEKAHQFLEERVRERTVELFSVNLRLRREIEERKQVEASLNRKVEEQKLLLNNIQTQIWYLTDVESYGAVNQAHVDFWGLDKAEIEGRRMSDLLDPQQVESLIADQKTVFTRGKRIKTEQWVVNGQGIRRLLSIIATPKLDTLGNVEYVVCSGEDITDYHDSKEKLRESKKRLDLAMEATSDALWDWDLRNKRIYFSPMFYTMLGYQPYEMPQLIETWQALIHPDDRAMADNRIKQYVRQTIDKIEIEYRLRTKQGGWRWIMARGKVVDRDETGTPIRMVGTHIDVTERRLNEEALRQSEADLREENLRLRSTLKSSNQFGKIIGRSPAMGAVYETILKAAPSSANIIIYGESGTGKELVAQTIHELSDLSQKPFVTVNCGAIPANLMESEFFGYKKGAFTGAFIDKPGYLDNAEGGILFLDEVAELDLNMQVKLLRAIEGGGYTPIGGRDVKKPKVRIIAATNRDLKSHIAGGLMRKDFYYRIHIIPIHLPPLRERKEDLPLLIHHFLRLLGSESNIPSIPESVMRSMQHYDWPGNVRELQNTLQRYITLKKIDFVDATQQSASPRALNPDQMASETATVLSLNDATLRFEKKYIQHLLSEYQWNRGQTAAVLKINRKTLFRKLKHFGL
ncbi:MAG: sigma 54-interacting transcriptional regulator [Pseudomonadota bacterium]